MQKACRQGEAGANVGIVLLLVIAERGRLSVTALRDRYTHRRNFVQLGVCFIVSNSRSESATRSRVQPVVKFETAVWACK